MASTTLPNGIIIPEKFSRDWYADLYHNWQELDNLLGGGTPKDGTLTIQKNGTTVGTFSANQATDETINIEVPDVNNGALTIQQNGTTVDTFTANSSSDKTVNISVPTKTSDLTNDSGFLTSHQSLSNYSTLANTIKSLSISGKTITYTKGDDTTGTLTTQDNNTWTAMVGATSSSNGSVGYVNAVPPKDGYNTKYLRADGTWQVPPDHTYNVYNKTLTIQKNGTNVATFTSNSNTDVTANITVPTKTSDLTNDSGFLTLESLSTNSIPFHNAYPRCKYLGSSITDAQNAAIKNRTYDDLFIGDYWTINGVNWRIVAIDYYYNIGDTNFGKGNIIVMPDTVLYNAQMNDTNTTAGAYVGSLMRTQNLNNARTIVRNAFGSHLANHRIVLANSVDTSGPNSWTWYDSDGVELPNEVQIYGTRVWGSALKGFDVATQKQQFPLLALAPQFVNIKQTYWLQDVSSDSVSSIFAFVDDGGNAANNHASVSIGVRPSVTLSYI